MATVSTSRASFQKIDGNIRLGRVPKKIASDPETGQINKAIIALNKAKNETNSEAAFIAALTEAFRLTRNIVRGRILD